MNKLPKPEGPCKVGTLLTSFKDENRKNSFTGTPLHLPVRVWYPADAVEGKETYRYSPEEWKLFRKNFYNLPSNKLLKVETNSYIDASVSKAGPFPVVVFSHGYACTMDVYIAYMEALASRGYVVFSVGNPAFASVLTYPDGTRVTHDRALYKELMADVKGIMKQYKAAEKILGNESADETTIRETTADLVDACSIYNDIVPPWSENLSFVADSIEKIASGALDSVLRNSMDITGGLGLMGMSYGGAAVLKAAQEDTRFTCLVDLDGQESGYIYKKSIDLPALFLMTKSFYWFCRLTFQQCTNDAFYVYFKDLYHMDLSDLVFTPSFMGKMMKMNCGKDGLKINSMVNDYITSFFERYLAGKKADLPDEKKYGNVSVQRRVKK